MHNGDVLEPQQLGSLRGRMQELKDFRCQGMEYLVDIYPAQWSKSHFSSRALCDYLANNLSESFNAMILEDRDKPNFSNVGVDQS